jgi:hypothetical protein
MDDSTAKRYEAEEDILTYVVSDEALERAAGAIGGVVCTDSSTENPCDEGGCSARPRLR